MLFKLRARIHSLCGVLGSLCKLVGCFLSSGGSGLTGVKPISSASFTLKHSMNYTHGSSFLSSGSLLVEGELVSSLIDGGDLDNLGLLLSGGSLLGAELLDLESHCR